MAEAPEAAELGLGEELVSAVAAQGLGITELWATRFEEARRDLERSAALAQQIGQPYIEYASLAHLAVADTDRSFARAAEHSRQAIDLAERHGWTDSPCTGVACAVLADMLAWQGRPEEAEPWVQRAERTMSAEAEPAARLAVLCIRGRLELVYGRDREALAAFRAADRLADRLAPSHPLVARNRAWLLYTMVRLGDTERAGQALSGLGGHDSDHVEARIAVSALRLAQDNPDAAAAALAPVLDGSAAEIPRMWLAFAFLLGAIALDALGVPMPPAMPWSARWTWPSPTARWRRSCCTRCRACWSVMPGTAPPTPPWSPRSAACSPGQGREGMGGWHPPMSGRVLGVRPPG